LRHYLGHRTHHHATESIPRTRYWSTYPSSSPSEWCKSSARRWSRSRSRSCLSTHNHTQPYKCTENRTAHAGQTQGRRRAWTTIENLPEGPPSQRDGQQYVFAPVARFAFRLLRDAVVGRPGGRRSLGAEVMGRVLPNGQGTHILLATYWFRPQMVFVQAVSGPDAPSPALQRERKGQTGRRGRQTPRFAQHEQSRLANQDRPDWQSN
jgi:hypothetical protein